MGKRTTPKVNFCMKLLAGKNVVLVEANGYESEIFVPIIHDGRISFRNIIPNRRCQLTVAPREDCKATLRLPADHGSGKSNLHPAAYSTPNTSAKIKPLGKENGRRDRVELESPNFGLRTPEPVRYAAVPSPNEVLREAMGIFPSPSKMQNHRRTSVSNKTRRSSGSVLPASPSPPLRISAGSMESDMSDVDTSPLRLPPTPRMNTPRNSLLQKVKDCRRPDTGKSPTNWRKCITPTRTYSRNALPLVAKRSPVAPLKKKRTENVLPTFLLNPTQGPKANVKVETKKRKFIIDRNCIISPNSFKKQLKSNYDNKVNLRTQLPRSKIDYSLAKAAAFDMLTNPTHPRMGVKLKETFRKKCTNKASSTHPKYKLLCSLSNEDTIDRALKACQKMHSQKAATLYKPPIRRVRTVGSHASRF